MLSEFYCIQHYAGENSPVAPYAKSKPKDKYAILYYKYNKNGELWEIVYEDYVVYKGAKIDFSEHLDLGSGNYGRSQCMYGKAGNLWKTQESYCIDGKWTSFEHKIDRKFQKRDDVYERGYLKERRFIGEKQKQFFNYLTGYTDGCIYFEWRDERADFVLRLIERYDSERRLMSQHYFEIKLSNPTDIRGDELLCLHYDGQHSDTIIQIDRILPVYYNEFFKDETRFEKELFSDFDKKGNWLQASVYKYNKLGGDGELVRSESREIAYDEATARELKAKFGALVAERSVGDEYFEK